MAWFHLVLFSLLFSFAFTIEARVFGADDLTFEEHKYLVKLKILYKGNFGMCSGSILDKHWVITSAHCFMGGEKTVGVYHQDAKGQRLIAKVDILNIFPHPDWIVRNLSMVNRAFDIALLKTTPITFSNSVQPIKLSRSYPRRGQSAIIAGFGESEADVDPPREGVVAIDWCDYGVPGLLCSRDVVRAGSGDSGGSLVSHGKLIGVTSASCKDVEKVNVCVTVYVSIAAHLKWLREVLLQ